MPGSNPLDRLDGGIKLPIRPCCALFLLVSVSSSSFMDWFHVSLLLLCVVLCLTAAMRSLRGDMHGVRLTSSAELLSVIAVWLVGALSL